MWLSVLALIIAAVSAIAGIWSAKEKHVGWAWFLTGLTLVGLVVGYFVASRENDQNQASDARINAQLELSRAAIELESLEVIWTIPDPPETLTVVSYYESAIYDGYAVSDDEISRQSQDLIDVVWEAYHRDYAVVPLLAALSNESWNVKPYFDGDVEAAEQIYADVPDDFDPVEDGVEVNYIGPRQPIIVLPINVGLDAAVAIGRSQDSQHDVELIANPDNLDALYNDVLIAEATKFSARGTISNRSLNLEFDYDANAFEDIIHFESENTLTLQLPTSFGFYVISADDLTSAEIVAALQNEGRAFSSRRDEFPIRSELTIRPNGNAAAELVYDVASPIIGEVVRDHGAYEDRELLFKYAYYEAKSQ